MAAILGLGLLAPGLEDGRRVRNVPPANDARARRLTRLELMALAAARQALPPQTEFQHLALVFGTGYGELTATTDFLETLATRGAEYGSALAFQESVHHAPAGQLSILLNAHGPSLTTSAREISGESALRVALTLLETRRAEQVLVVAADECPPTLEAGYRAFGALATNDRDASASALRPGEGAAAVLLGNGPSALSLETCNLTAHPCATLRFPTPEQMRPLLRESQKALSEAAFVSLAAPNLDVQEAERGLFSELAPGATQWVDSTVLGFHPSAGLLRVVTAAQRLQAGTAASLCAIHGLAMGGGQSFTLVRHARS